MTPRRRWDDFSRPAPPRRSVEGGVVVAKPGAVSEPLAAEMVAAALVECAPQILARGRTYARAGQVVAVQAGQRGFTAQIQGSAARPYEVRLDRTTISGADRVAADCTCPYGCDDGWCKHAAALAYVAAFLLDRDAASRFAWTGQPEQAPFAQGVEDADAAGPDEAVRSAVPPSIAGVAVLPASTLRLDEADLATLRNPLPRRSAAALLAAAEALVPHPWSASPVRSQAPEEDSVTPIDLRESGSTDPRRGFSGW